VFQSHSGGGGLLYLVANSEAMKTIWSNMDPFGSKIPGLGLEQAYLVLIVLSLSKCI